MKILLIGPPASGKGTVGHILSERTGLPLISAGDLLRHIPKDHPRYDEIHQQMDSGELVSQDFVAELLQNRTSQTDTQHGYLLDGWGRTSIDLEHFDPGFDKVIFLNISDDLAIKRVTGRRLCEADGNIYNIYTLPKEELEKCPGPLTLRDDDKEEVIKHRLEVYKQDTLPVIEKFRKDGILLEIDGSPAPKDVVSDIISKLDIHND